MWWLHDRLLGSHVNYRCWLLIKTISNSTTIENLLISETFLNIGIFDTCCLLM